MIQMNLQNRKRLTEAELMVASGRGRQGVWDGRVHPAAFKAGNHHRPALQRMELCSRWCGSRAGREVWGRMDTRVYVAESLHCSPETITALLMGCTPVQNKKFKRKHKNVQIVFFLPAFPSTHRSWSSEE